MPSCTETREWVSPRTLASRLGRNYWTIIRGCREGTVLDFGYTVKREPGLKGRYWIGIPLNSSLASPASRTIVPIVPSTLTTPSL